MSLDDALRAHTVVAAPHIRRPDLGSITPGKRGRSRSADSADETPAESTTESPTQPSEESPAETPAS